MMEAETIKAMTVLSEVVGRYVSLKPRSGEHWGRCPFHDERTPSFSVNDAKRVFNCFGCEASGDVFDFIQRIEKTDFNGAKAFLVGDNYEKFSPISVPEKTCPGVKDLSDGWPSQYMAREVNDLSKFSLTAPSKKNHEKALQIWHATKPAAGTLAKVYLRSRGITIPPPPTIRFHPALKHYQAVLDLPALVAGVCGPDRKIIAVQRIYLRADGQGKADVDTAKMSLGRVKGAAVRLSPLKETLVLTEGIEDGLSVLQARPEFSVWATLGTQNLANQQIPASVKRIIIGADNDPAGKEAAEKAAAHYAAQGFTVKIATPQDGAKDFNAQVNKKEIAA